MAPLYFEGKIGFGVISQSFSAFGNVLSDFSIIVDEIQSLSAFSAVIDRLGKLSRHSPSISNCGVTSWFTHCIMQRIIVS